MNVYVSHAGASTRKGGGIGSFFCFVGFSSLSTKKKREKKRERKKEERKRRALFREKGHLSTFKKSTFH